MNEQHETASRPRFRLMREAQALAKLSHPNVVAVHDVGTFEDGVYIAMEYVKGKTLREWIREGQPAQKASVGNTRTPSRCNGFWIEHPLVVWPLTSIGSVLVRQGLPEKALVHLERAVTICKKMTCEPELHGRGLFVLAKSLVAIGNDKERAIKLAQQAKEVYGRTPKAFTEELKEVDVWLKKHALGKLSKGLPLAKQR